MDPTKWTRHASGEGKELDGVSLLIENFTLSEGKRFFVSFNDNAFLRRMDAKHGIETPSHLSSAQPETALIDYGPWHHRAAHRVFRAPPLATFARYLKAKKRVSAVLRALQWLHDLYSPRYFILRGDHRDAYEPLVPQGFDACFRYFKERWELGDAHFWSHPPKDV